MERRKITNKYLSLLLLAWLILLTPTGYYLYKQHIEDTAVTAYLEENGFSDLPISKETAIRISNQIRNEFNIDEKSFKTLKLSKRPFLRNDTLFLLTHKEGLCGEGTRVIVNLLNELGFDATRITLYNRNLKGLHTLISVVINGEEFLIDSINSPEEINNIINNYNISTADFKVIRYSDNVNERRKFEEAIKTKTKEEYAAFFNQFWLYSYEALPYAKLLSKLGINVRTFNFMRPHPWLSSLAEKPHLLTACFTFTLSLMLLYLIHKLGIIKRFLKSS